ncbi:S4 domain-containing protein YaaA [Tuberibacillus sp. Marseille-P3662]|uniref:S4 domain-containing protein YaaA n=1 Tax=Tuberibacillus sp. Marseille-P3662 TaxID=1965358 RepID=UPI000A1CCEFE|nr:S4 domain-containing protein YaaA [Tuberibacillus sp. Marseille-P3662]
MESVKLKGDQDYITLGQLLQFENIITSGGQSKWFLAEFNVFVNNEPEDRRGKKLYEGDQISVENHGTYTVIR